MREAGIKGHGQYGEYTTRWSFGVLVVFFSRRHDSDTLHDILSASLCHLICPSFIRYTFLNYTTLSSQSVNVPSVSGSSTLHVQVRKIGLCSDCYSEDQFLIFERMVAGMRSYSRYVYMPTHNYKSAETSLEARLAGCIQNTEQILMCRWSRHPLRFHLIKWLVHIWLYIYGIHDMQTVRVSGKMNCRQLRLVQAAMRHAAWDGRDSERTEMKDGLRW